VIAWGSTPPNCSVNGLVTLLRRPEWRAHADGERIRQLLKPLLDSGDETIRMLSSMAISFIFEPGELTKEIAGRLCQEESSGVLEVLLGALADQVGVDADGVDERLSMLSADPKWSVLAGAAEDRTEPPNARRSEVGDLLLRIIVFLAFARATPFVSSLVDTWEGHLPTHPATLGRLVAWTRPYLNPPGGVSTESQSRAFALLAKLAEASLTITDSAQGVLTSGATLPDEQRRDLEAAGWIANCIARELFHASGAYQSQEERLLPDDRVVSPSFCALALPMIETLARIRAAAIAHHLVQTLVFLSRLEPRRAFLAIAAIASPGSGYEYESLGESEVLDLVDSYLAERREVILGDPECLSALRQILETFVAAGSDRAIRRVQDLGDLFR
jgi:hypothetical protein